MAVEPSGGSVLVSSPVKREKSLGNGKHCHQCRQNRDAVAACKNQRNNRPCLVKICNKCLLNRYGEKAEEVAALEEWSCPKCRGICNCSVCMKRRGHQPTGILINTAKATGFSSVSEMLLKSAERKNDENVGADMTASLKKEAVSSPRKMGKENSFAGKLDANSPESVDKNSKNVKGMLNGKADDNTSKIINQAPDKREINQEGLMDIHDYNKHDGISSNENDSCNLEKKPKKMKRERLGEMSNVKVHKENKKQTGAHVDEKKPKKSRIDGLDENEPEEDVNFLNHQTAESHTDGPLPVGRELTSVAGIDVCAEDAGSALQLLEFCSVFGKILDLRKGEAEYCLQDVLHARSTRQGKFSSTVQFHMRLLSIIQADQGEKCAKLSPSYGKNSWFHMLKKCLSKSQHISKARGMKSLEKAADYETLNASEKLSILNLLCDEVLGTEKVRNWIDHQNARLGEKVKEAKQKILDARDKENSLKQKMKDEIAKAIMARGGAQLSISEQEAIVSHTKSEAAQAHAALLESKGMLLKSNRTSDAMRIQPIFMGHGGHVYWKLKCSEESDILHQVIDVGKGDTLTLDEKWFTLDAEGKELIEKYISSLRRK